MTSISSCTRKLVLGAAAFLGTVCQTLLPAEAQKDWEDSPYRIDLWMALEGPDITPQFEQRLRKFFLDRSDAVCGPTWTLNIEDPPQSLRSQLLSDAGNLSVDAIVAVQEDVFQKKRDKLLLLSILSTSREYVVTSRELDIRTRLLGPKIEHRIGQPAILMYAAFDAVVQAFLPITRVDEVEPKVAMLRVRASGLFHGESGPCVIPRSSVLTPIVRINDRHGEPTKGGITTVPWTYLYLPKEIPDPIILKDAVAESESGPEKDKSTETDKTAESSGSAETKSATKTAQGKTTATSPGESNQVSSATGTDVQTESPAEAPRVRVKDLTWQAQIYTGRRGALGGRVGSRLERYAILVKPTRTTTTVLVRSRGKTPTLLEGYELYAKNPLIESVESLQEPENQSPAELLGRTNWQGMLNVSASDDFPVRMLYVKSGGQLLAKLPLVVGTEPEVVAEVANDDHRLAVEGFCMGIQALVMDLVARRELLASRIRKRIEEKKLDEAQSLLEELGAFPTKEQILQRVSARQSNLTAADRTNQARIDKLFADVTNLVNKYIDRTLTEKLWAELAKARGS